MIYHYRFIIQYKGTRYLGWQIQPEGLTVQGEINKALRAISKAEDVRSLGAGRTDAGVHALGQVVKVSIPLEIRPESLQKAMNSHLPTDIRVIDAVLSDEDFMPTVHAKSKEYHYRFTCSRTSSAFQSELIQNFPFEVDLEKMRSACKLLIGKHDFLNFYCEGTEVASRVREIYECEIKEVQSFDMMPSHYLFRIVGNGFLKQMVRCLVGGLWSVGRGKISLHEFQNALGHEKVDRPGPVAPPNGLYMVRVNY